MSNTAIGRPMEVLLVEDSLTDARLTMGALQRGMSQHRLTLVRDGAEAIEFLRQEGVFTRAPRPDLILLDLFLPKKDGLEVLSEIKADYDLKDIPVVILTSSEAVEDRSRCELLHVDSYITKPVNVEKFLAVVKNLRHHLQSDVIVPSAK